MTKIAFLGLGQMGTPMATRLLAAGHELTVWNRTIERAEPLRDNGYKVELARNTLVRTLLELAG